MKQTDLCEICIKDNGLSVSEVSINSWCTDKSTPRKKQLIQIADYFDVDIEYLQCKQLERRIKHSSNKRPIDFSKYDVMIDNNVINHAILKDNLFKQIISLYHIDVFEVPTKLYKDSYIFKEIHDNYIYTIEYLFDVDVESEIQLTFADQSTVQITHERLDSFIDDILKYMDYQIDNLKKIGDSPKE